MTKTKGLFFISNSYLTKSFKFTSLACFDVPITFTPIGKYKETGFLITVAKVVLPYFDLIFNLLKQFAIIAENYLNPLGILKWGDISKRTPSSVRINICNLPALFNALSCKVNKH